MRNWRKNRTTVTVLKRGLILCEGETEQNYFVGLITQEQFRRKFASINVEIYKPKFHSPKGLVKEAKRLMAEAKKEKDPYNFVWVVFDHDGHANISDAFYEAHSHTPQINIAFSVRCFEFFVLLHFKKSTKAYAKCDDIISELRKFLPDYKKATNLFNLLKPNINTAYQNCKWCKKFFDEELNGGKKPYQCDPYSNIHELVEFLFNLIDVQLPLQ